MNNKIDAMSMKERLMRATVQQYCWGKGISLKVSKFVAWKAPTWIIEALHMAHTREVNKNGEAK